MKTSRIEGLLVINCKKPYQIAKNGINQDATEIICKEINFATEGIADDLEQMFFSAMADSQKRNPNSGTSTDEDVDKQIKENQDFVNNDNPIESEIDNKAMILEYIFKINQAYKFTDIEALFGKLVNAGLIMAENETKLTTTHPIWMKISREDKRRIMFSYISFFANPLSIPENAIMIARENNITAGATVE